MFINTVFSFNDVICKQIFGCPIGSPLSPVEAQMLVEKIILETGDSAEFIKRYIDDGILNNNLT